LNPPSLAGLVRYFLQLGLTGFGGPVALANYMRRDLVDRFRWISGEEYDEGLAIATACPGPLAYQLGVYCGYVLHGVVGAVAVAISFATAPFFIVTLVAWLYVRYGSTWELRAIFYGVGPVVIAIIARSCWDLGRKTLRRQWLAFVFAGVACIITIVVQQELIALFLVAGILGIVVFYQSRGGSPTPPPLKPTSGGAASLFAVATSLYQNVTAPQLFWFFFKTGLLVFGSGLVVVPFLKAYVVDQYHWLSNQAFVDAVAVGIVSPGPVVITATFVGFLNDRWSGAVAATLGIFTPSIVFVLLGTPLLRRYRNNGRLQGFIRGVTVAVVGVLLGTSYLVARSTIHDLLGFVILAVALIALWPKWKIPEPLLVGAGAAIGLLASLVMKSGH
jgi:chromate transporter